jgi:hypothetical protein
MQMLEHSPTLNTVIMVENTLQGMDDSVVKVADLKKALPKQVNHSTLMNILEYLEESNKIAVGVRGVTWIYNRDPKLRDATSRGLEL